MAEKSYPYQARFAGLVIACGILGACALLLAHQAMTNDRGLIIQRSIRLEPQEASLFWWCLAGFSALLAVYFILHAVARLVKPQILSVDSTGLTIPYGLLLNSRAHVKFSEIQSVSEGTIQGVIFLKLKTQRRTYYISPSYLPSPNDYDEIKAAIAFAVSTVRS